MTKAHKRLAFYFYIYASALIAGFMRVSKKLFTYNNMFWLLALVTIAPVWIFPHFLSCDGPCHLYNAGILSEFWWGDAAYFDKFYTLNLKPDPNWLSHIMLAMLLRVFGADTADKLGMTICVLGFVFGFRYLVHSFAAQQKGLAFFGLLFVWQLAMYMGFYNYMLSLGLFFFIGGYWLRRGADVTWKQTALLTFATTILFFAHLMGLFFLLLLLAMMFIIQLADKKTGNKKERLLTFATRACVSVLPALLLTARYVKDSYHRTDNNSMEPIEELWWKLRDGFTLQSLSLAEYGVAQAVVIVIALLLIAGIVYIITTKQNRQWLIMLAFLLFTIGYYFLGFESLFGGSYIRYRLETLAYIFSILFVATIRMHRSVQFLGALCVLVLMIIFNTIRYPVYASISNIVAEYRSLDKFIEDESVVMPIRYEQFYTHDSEVIANKVLIFTHVAETMAPEKKLVFLDNYEANTKYFPLLWREELNPYVHLAVENEGHEMCPPHMDLEQYIKDRVDVKYVVVWGRSRAPQDDFSVKQQNELLLRMYEPVHTTPVFGIELYRLKSEWIGRH